MKKGLIRDPELCSGCDLCKDGRIPKFKSEDEERDFWINHSPLDFPEEFEEAGIEIVDLRRKRVPISIRLDPVLKENVKRMAHIKKVRYQTLIQEWIREKLKEEERALIKIAANKRI